MMTVPQAFDLGQQLQRDGRLSEARALYRQILTVQPTHAGALHMLGVMAHRSGYHDLAVDWIGRAIRLNSESSAAYSDLGEAYRAMNQLDEAIASYRSALERNPRDAETHNNLGIALTGQRRFDEAMEAFESALRLAPGFTEAHNNLGLILAEQGRFAEAIGSYRRALEIKADAEVYYNLGFALASTGQLDEAVEAYHRALELQPNFATALNNLGLALAGQGQWDEAIEAYRRALAIGPELPETFNNLGNALRQKDQLDEAVAAYRTALQLEPNFAEAHNNLGTALEERLQMEAALEAYQAALRLRPDLAETHNNIGNTLAALGRLDEAIAAFEVALKLAPTYERARFNCSLALLLRGNFERGWSDYESRWAAENISKRDFAQPRWDGSALDGRRLLVSAEQGFGDALQFIRYARLAAERGGKVIVECPRTLRELFQGAPGVAEVVTAGDALPSFDVHLPLLSLPLVFRTSRATIPGEVPYLSADPARRRSWTERLGTDRPRPRIGLAWAGNPKNRRSRARNIPFQELVPLLRQAGVDFFSLQLGDGAEDLRELPDDIRVVDFTKQIEDFADTAAFLAELDLVISADTAVAHLAGAMARPTWTLLPFAPDWRWGLERDDTPWYPTMRLFRQPAMGDWGAVVRRLSAELSRWMEWRR